MACEVLVLVLVPVLAYAPGVLGNAPPVEVVDT